MSVTVVLDKEDTTGMLLKNDLPKMAIMEAFASASSRASSCKTATKCACSRNCNCSKSRPERLRCLPHALEGTSVAEYADTLSIGCKRR